MRVWEVIAAGGVDLANASRFRNRGEVRRYSMSSADAEHLVSSSAAALSGVGAAIYYGEPLSPDGADINMYVSCESHEVLAGAVAAVPDPLGAVVLRVVADEVWPAVVSAAHRSGGQMVIPRLAVALDLMESGDPRHWVAAEHLVASDD